MKKAYSSVALLLFLTLSPMVTAVETGDERAIQSCLQHWGKHPFSATKAPFRVLSGKVKILGIGGDLTDDRKTKRPELVLVKANVNVLSKTEIQLLNPNGWYCLKGKVAVLAKTTINLACHASLASSIDGATVLSGNDNDDGVTVLGASRLNRVDCAKGKGR